jgi:hypothetical protein
MRRRSPGRGARARFPRVPDFHARARFPRVPDFQKLTNIQSMTGG